MFRSRRVVNREGTKERRVCECLAKKGMNVVYGCILGFGSSEWAVMEVENMDEFAFGRNH
jgi:hypothetical protein